MDIRNFEHQLRMKKEQYRMLKNQRGMTLLEIIIVLAIIGVISAGVVILAQRAFDSKALSDLANNASVVRVAVKDAYGPSGSYPVEVPTNTAALTSTSIRSDVATPVGKLVSMGKLSPDEALNGISGNYISIGRATLGTGDTARTAGYYVVLNGLNQTQCRGLLTQMGNQWDYVAVYNTGYASGSYGTAAVGAQLDATVTTIADAAITTSPAIVRSLATSVVITPDNAVLLCGDGSNNGLVLGSR